MKIAIVTGAYGFAGANLVEHLLSKDYKVYAVGRRKSLHNERFQDAPADRLIKVFLEMEEYDKLPEDIGEKADFFFHLAWGGGREDFETQMKNVDGALKAIEAAAKISGDIRFVGIGSQAEYGIKSDHDLITEDMRLEPFSSYGACKAAAFYLLRNRANQLGIDFIWGRIFSLIGKYESSGRMIPDLIAKLSRGEQMGLSSCEQYWDYLDAADAAAAIEALGNRGVAGEDYNIAHGDFRPLKDYVMEVADIIANEKGREDTHKLITFGDKASPFVSLRPSAEKIKRDTGWAPEVAFENTIMKYVM